MLTGQSLAQTGQETNVEGLVWMQIGDQSMGGGWLGRGGDGSRGKNVSPGLLIHREYPVGMVW